MKKLIFVFSLIMLFSGFFKSQTPIKIAQDGKVGIDLPANTSPTQELHVDGNLRLTDHFYDASNSSGSVGNVLTRGANGTSWTNLSTESEFPGNELLNAVIHGEETHWASVELAGQYANSVFQGFVYDNKNNYLYTSHKSSATGTEQTTLNKYELDGDGSPDVVSTSNEIYVGHAQDLSIEYIDESDFRLWTSNQNGDGASRINFNGSSTTFTSYSLLPSGYSSSTPTVSTNGKYLVVRGYQSSINRISVYYLSEVINSNGGAGVTPFLEFDTHPDQNNSQTMKFQGILCDNDVIYCLTGYNTIADNKLLYAYTLKGEVLFKKELTTGKDWAVDEGNKWEPEGMAIYHPHPNIKSLLIGICAQDSDGWSGGATNFDVDTKRIYSLGLGNGIWSIDGDKHPHDIGLYFSGGSRDITYKSSHALQFGRWDPSTRTYDEAMRLNSSGQLLINVTSIPSSYNNYKLYVNGSSGGTNNWNSSDIRWKENVYSIENALSRITKLRGVHYTWKLGDETESKGFDDKVHYGVIAQEVENYFPELINNPGETKAYKHVEYNGFVGIFIEAIKEQQNMIDSLSKELLQMKKEFDNFKKIAVVRQ